MYRCFQTSISPNPPRDASRCGIMNLEGVSVSTNTTEQAFIAFPIRRQTCPKNQSSEILYPGWWSNVLTQTSRSHRTMAPCAKVALPPYREQNCFTSPASLYSMSCHCWTTVPGVEFSPTDLMQYDTEPTLGDMRWVARGRFGGRITSSSIRRMYLNWLVTWAPTNSAVIFEPIGTLFVKIYFRSCTRYD